MNRDRLRSFVRDVGPVAFEIDMLDEGHLPQAADILLASGLSWSWESTATERGITTDRRVPTALTPASAPDLTADARWRNGDGYGRFLALYATQQSAPLVEELSSATRLFAAGEPTPLSAVVIQVGDAEHELAFVADARDVRLVALLEAFGAPLDAYATIPYHRLGTASLEVQLGLAKR